MFLSNLLIKPLKIIGSKKNLTSISSVTVATFFNAFVGFVVNLIAAKVFGVEQFGLFALSVTVINMTSVFGEFGIDLTLMRLFNKYQGIAERQNQLLNTVFRFKLFIFILLLSLSMPISVILINLLDLSVDNLSLFILSFVTAGFFLFWNYLISVFKANRNYIRVAKYTLSYGGLRIVFLSISFFILPHSPFIWLLSTYTIPKLIVILVGLLFNSSINVYRKSSSGHYLRMLKEVISYSKWVALSGIAYSYILGALRFVLAYLANPTAVGIFSAGINFTLAFTVFNQSIRAILFPHVTALSDQVQIDYYLFKIKKLAPYYFFASILGIIVLGLFQWFLLGTEYQLAFPIFLITSASLALTIFMGFKTMVAHTYMNPEMLAYVNVARLFSTIILAFLLIPILKEIGAAIAYAIPLIVGEFYLYKHIDFLIQNNAFDSETESVDINMISREG